MLRQSNIDDCGKTVVRELLSYHFRNKGFYHERLSFDCKDFLSIRECLMSYGLIYESYLIDDIEKLNRKSLPAIVQISSMGRNHFVLLTAIKRKVVEIIDPEFGKYQLSKEEFLSCFTGKGMVFSKKMGKPKTTSARMLRIRDIVFYVTCFLLMSSSLVCFLLFSGNGESFLFGIILAVLFFSTALLLNGYNFYLKKNLEKRFLLPYLNRYMQCDDYSTIVKIIMGEIKRTSSLIGYGVTFVGLITILLLSSYYFAFIILIVLLFSLLRSVLKEEKNSVERYCTLKENEFLNSLGKSESVSLYNKAQNKAERYVLLVVFVKVVEILCYVIISLLIMYLNPEKGFDDFLLPVVMSIVFSTSMDKVLGLLDFKDEKARLLNSLKYSLFEIAEVKED